MNTSAEIKFEGTTYRIRFQTCNKKNCKCHTPGQEHGPYVYAFQPGQKAKFIGKEFPAHILAHAALLKKGKDKIHKTLAAIEKKRSDLYRQISECDDQISAIYRLQHGGQRATRILQAIGLGEFTATPNGDSRGSLRPAVAGRVPERAAPSPHTTSRPPLEGVGN